MLATAGTFALGMRSGNSSDYIAPLRTPSRQRSRYESGPLRLVSAHRHQGRRRVLRMRDTNWGYHLGRVGHLCCHWGGHAEPIRLGEDSHSRIALTDEQGPIAIQLGHSIPTAAYVAIAFGLNALQFAKHGLTATTQGGEPGLWAQEKMLSYGHRFPTPPVAMEWCFNYFPQRYQVPSAMFSIGGKNNAMLQ